MSTYPDEKQAHCPSPPAERRYEWDDDSTKEALPGQGPIEQRQYDTGMIPYRPNEEDPDQDGQKIPISASSKDASAPEVVSYAPYYSPSAGTWPDGDPRSSYMRASSRGSRPVGEQEMTGVWAQRRSKKRKLFIGCIVAAIVVIGGVLGGVLGTQLHKQQITPEDQPSNGNDTPNVGPLPLRGLDKTGIATASSADGAGMLLYFQSLNGTVHEALYSNYVLSATNPDRFRAQEHTLVPVRDISPSSPLAAVSIIANSTLQNLLFYTNADLRIMLIRWTNTTSTWSDPTLVSPSSDTQRLFSGSPGLCACASTVGGFQGVRVYFSQRAGYVQEVWWNFANKDVSLPWNAGQTYPRSDPGSGVACSAIQNGNDTYTNVYMRNGTTGGLAHWFLKSYGTGRRDAWTSVLETEVERVQGTRPANGTGFAAVVDPGQTVQYLFYEGGDGELKMVSAEAGTPPAKATGTFFGLGQPGEGKLGAHYVDGAPVVVRQVGQKLSGLRVARQGGVLGNGTMVS
ncbi:hypothetical protein CAC42_7699 [Sphaceloma murrayae]|uniref:Fucose-specific lectin n=1 Tax=Sphaceloma murrayae TaxID=2082308 RepID=A0A2K1QXF1_9PEZI|nr:hypothetical protein CAC42_7699 [Sphaceloma murrayae]